MTPSWPYPFWIAHRGAGRQAPENTLAAFRVGQAQGFSMFECDVTLSADEVPLLLHDARLERTTSGRGAVNATPWAVLATLDAGAWHSPAFAGEPLPTLAALAAWVRAAGVAVNLEIKPVPGLEARTGSVVAAAAQGLWAGAGRPPLLSSFSVEALQAAAAAAPALPRALLLDQKRPGWLVLARDLGCVAAVLHQRLLDADTIADLHRAGLRALAYTVNDLAVAAALRQAGLDGLITDDVIGLGPAT